jgi:putative transposase
MAALVSQGSEAKLIWQLAPRSLRSQDLLTVLRSLPHQGGRLAVVMDNGSIRGWARDAHPMSKVIKEAVEELREEGIELYYLPPYSPELNLMEPIFAGIKAHGLPERSYPTVPALTEAIDLAFSEAEARLLTRVHSLHQLRPAA